MDELNQQARDITVLYLSKYFKCDSKDAVHDILDVFIQECVSRSMINNIESNVLRHPDQKESLYKLICKEFGISYLWLTQRIDPMKRTN